MNRNSNYIINKIIDPTGRAKKAQVGVDLTVGKIEKVEGIAIFDENSKLLRDYVEYKEAPTYEEIIEQECKKNNMNDSEELLDSLNDFFKSALNEIEDLKDIDINAYEKIMGKFSEEELHALKNIDSAIATAKNNYKDIAGKYKDAYYLEPNSTYLIEFEQGIKTLNPNEWGFILHRSSLNRTGVYVTSSLWDPNFSTDKMGTTLHTGDIPVILPKGTRIAQFIIFDCEEVPEEDLYNGQWQGMTNHA